MQCLILVRRHHSELFNKKFIYFFSGKLTLILEYLSSGPDAERWLKAFEDPLASIYTFSCCVALCDLTGDGDTKLVVADLGTGNYNMKLRVYKGTQMGSLKLVS